MLTQPIVYEATKEDVDEAVAAAKAAFPAWAALSPFERGRYLAKLADLIVEATAELAKLEAESMGRPVSTYFDATVGSKHFRYFSEAAYPQGGSSLNTPGFVNITLKQPVGVVGAIIPWNAPLVFFCKKLAPALAAGNAVVLKSSEKAPLTVGSLLEMWLIYADTLYSHYTLLALLKRPASLQASSMFSPGTVPSRALRLHLTWMSGL